MRRLALSRRAYPWRVVKTRRAWSSPHIRLREDTVRTHLGHQITYTYQENHGSVIIVGLTEQQDVILVRQYRHPVRRWCWELPAGHVERGQNALAAAKSELREEAGGLGGHWRRIAQFFPYSCSSSEKITVYMARNITLGANHVEPTELLYVKPVPWRKALAMAEAGQITDGTSALALLLCRNEFTNRREKSK